VDLLQKITQGVRLAVRSVVSSSTNAEGRIDSVDDVFQQGTQLGEWGYWGTES
jgi:hypothetical protein